MWQFLSTMTAHSPIFHHTGLRPPQTRGIAKSYGAVAVRARCLNDTGTVQGERICRRTVRICTSSKRTITRITAAGSAQVNRDSGLRSAFFKYIYVRVSCRGYWRRGPHVERGVSRRRSRRPLRRSLRLSQHQIVTLLFRATSLQGDFVTSRIYSVDQAIIRLKH